MYFSTESSSSQPWCCVSSDEASGHSDPQTGSVLQGQQPFVCHTSALHVKASDRSRSLGKLTFTPQGLDAGCGGHV